LLQSKFPGKLALTTLSQNFT